MNNKYNDKSTKYIEYYTINNILFMYINSNNIIRLFCVCVCVRLHWICYEIQRMVLKQRYEIIFRYELQNAGSYNVFSKY